jgi:molybdopterin/thiamine biosynthesis adenylyltransferase
MTDKNNIRLSEDELQRYKRQIMMSGWGEEGQRKLKGSTVFMVGAGGLGSPVSIYLAVAGIGKIVISDFDSPDLTNLNRQILHTVNDIGKNKAISAKETLSEINPDVEVVPVTEQITAENIAKYAADADIIVDCLDNFQARHILNDYSVKTKKPLVHGGIYGMSGQLTFFHPPETGCLSCIFPSAPAKEVFPVLGATPAVIGCLQAMEVIKYLLGKGTNLKNVLLTWDGEKMDFRKLNLRKSPNCPVCGNGKAE